MVLFNPHTVGEVACILSISIDDPDGLTFLSARLDGEGYSPVPTGDDGSSGCFIATAAFDSDTDTAVKILRGFRDGYLLTNQAGRIFVKRYYQYSPGLARYISEHEGVKPFVRAALYPMVGISYVTLHTSAAQKVLIGFGFIGLTVLMFSGKRPGK